jgi:putative flavoprotein involved in K+ transport
MFQRVGEAGLAAPPCGICTPVWEPKDERTGLNIREAGIGSVVWCIGFQPDFRWLDAPVFNGRGQPGHVRGVAAVPGLCFCGLSGLHTWGSGRFSGVARDALFLAQATLS